LDKANEELQEGPVEVGPDRHHVKKMPTAPPLCDSPWGNPLYHSVGDADGDPRLIEEMTSHQALPDLSAPRV